MIKILLVEDNDVVRQILHDMIVLQNDLEVTGTAENGLAALELLENGLQADIVLADLNMARMDGIELTERITGQYSELRVIVLTMHAKAAYYTRVTEAGARGYLLKNGDLDELYSAIRKVHAGEIFVGADVND